MYGPLRNCVWCVVGRCFKSPCFSSAPMRVDEIKDGRTSNVTIIFYLSCYRIGVWPALPVNLVNTLRPGTTLSLSGTKTPLCSDLNMNPNPSACIFHLDFSCNVPIGLKVLFHLYFFIIQKFECIWVSWKQRCAVLCNAVVK